MQQLTRDAENNPDLDPSVTDDPALIDAKLDHFFGTVRQKRHLVVRDGQVHEDHRR